MTVPVYRFALLTVLTPLSAFALAWDDQAVGANIEPSAMPADLMRGYTEGCERRDFMVKPWFGCKDPVTSERCQANPKLAMVTAASQCTAAPWNLS